MWKAGAGMSEPTHHLDEEWLIAQAGGSLGPAEAVLVATHAALCSRCADRLGRYEAVAAGLMESLDPAPMEEGGLQSLLARIDAEAPGAAPIAPAAPGAGNGGIVARLPEPLRAVAAPLARERPWTRLAAGIEMLDLGSGDGVQAALARMEPGRSIPHHGHSGTELTLVLEGGFHDHRGRYGPGDVAVAGIGDRHRPVADPGEDCVAFAVALGDVRFTGLLGLLQRARRALGLS